MFYNAELDATITVIVNSDVPNADGQVGAPGVALALIPAVSRTSPALYD